MKKKVVAKVNNMDEFKEMIEHMDVLARAKPEDK